MRVLCRDTKRWSKIYALSRRPPSGDWPSAVEHISIDFLKEAKDIASVLKERNIKPDYIFFFTYVLVTDEKGALQWGDKKLVEQNGKSVCH